MKRLFFSTVSLVAILLVVSCAPAPAAPTETINVLPATLAPVESAPATEAAQPVVIEATATVAESAPTQAVAPQRGDNLEATDPATVSLASGQLQLVEFFRFT